ncbi:hypothetical protein ACIQGZ_17390 [Streptomyces sp. NPDC092296]|uniref:hypothetical protein n=1 Tax=Streptomyces sp. NPDC092296 TaxID=3366012 RepID=UPI0038014D32
MPDTTPPPTPAETLLAAAEAPPGWPEDCLAGQDITAGPRTGCPSWTSFKESAQ